MAGAGRGEISGGGRPAGPAVARSRLTGLGSARAASRLAATRWAVVAVLPRSASNAVGGANSGVRGSTAEPAAGSDAADCLAASVAGGRIAAGIPEEPVFDSGGGAKAFAWPAMAMPALKTAALAALPIAGAMAASAACVATGASDCGRCAGDALMESAPAWADDAP